MTIMSIFSDSFWSRNVDPRVGHFPFMSDGFPWRVMSICLVYLFIVKVWRPTIKSSKVDMKPWLLVQNGLYFGIHGAGILVGLALSNVGRDGFDCSPIQVIPYDGNLTYDYVKSESLVHLTAVLMLIRFFMLSEAVVLTMHNGRKVSNWRVMNDMSIFLFTFFGTKYLPGGPSMFFGLTYMSFNSFTYGYYTLKCGYPDTDKMVQSAKKFFVQLKFVWAILSIGHYLYLHMTPACYASPVIHAISFLELFHGLGTMAAAIHGWRQLKRQERIDQYCLNNNNELKMK